MLDSTTSYIQGGLVTRLSMAQAEAILASDWLAERERAAGEKAWDEGVKAHARQQLDIAYGRARQFSDPVNPCRADRLASGARDGEGM